MTIVNRIAAAIANARGARRGVPKIVNVLELLSGPVLEEIMDDARAVADDLELDNVFEFVPRQELVTYENSISQRRDIEEKLAGYGWGPKKIGEHLWRLHRHLVPSDTLEQVIDLVRKDLKVIFSDVEDAEDALSRGAAAMRLLRRRLMEQYEVAHGNSTNPTLSEPYRASQAKLLLELTDKLAKLDGIDLDKLASKGKPAERWRVQVGDHGVARTHEDDDERTPPS